MGEKDFSTLYSRLREEMLAIAGDLKICEDKEGLLYINAKEPDSKGRKLYFGGVQIKKNYVSYHLMAVYMNPKLLEQISQPLRKRMQGKSCFNFSKVDEELLDELRLLTKQSYDWCVANASTFQY